MTINWNGAELNLGSLAALAAITFLINAASTILDRLFWTNGLKERIGLIKEMSELAANGMLPEKVSSQYIEDATQWIESHVTKRNFLSMLVGTFVRGSLFLYLFVQQKKPLNQRLFLFRHKKRRPPCVDGRLC